MVFGVLLGFSPRTPAKCLPLGFFYSKVVDTINWLVTSSRASVSSMIDLVDQ